MAMRHGALPATQIWPEQNNSLSIGVKFSRDKTADYLRVVGFNELLKNEIVFVSSGSTYANELQPAEGAALRSTDQ